MNFGCLEKSPQAVESDNYGDQSCRTSCNLFGGDRNGNTYGNDSPEKILSEVEQDINRNLYSLSMKDREAVFNDIHGVSEDMNETPEMINLACAQLEMEVCKDKFSSSSMRLVFQTAPTYIRSLYLRFLRNDSFQISQTAERMKRHFDVKLELFGIDRLNRDISLADFTPDDRRTLEHGFYQLLPKRDTAGRAIFMKIWYHQFFVEKINVSRIFWYILNTAAIDEETQKKGMVFVLYNVASDWIKRMDVDLFLRILKVRNASPIKLMGAHYCFKDPAFGALINIVNQTVERPIRVRTRMHRGSHVENQYQLLSFGISALAVDSEGVMSKREHMKWIKMREKQEELARVSPGKPMIIIPSRNDVLFGKGKPVQYHLGNMRFGELLEKNVEQYFSTRRRKEKVAIVTAIIEEVKKGGGRFLRQDNDGIWEEVDSRTAFDKVGHGLRNRKGQTVTILNQKKTPSEKRNSKAVVSNNKGSFLTSDSGDDSQSTKACDGSVTKKIKRQSLNAIEPQILEDIDLDPSLFVPIALDSFANVSFDKDLSNLLDDFDLAVSKS